MPAPRAERSPLGQVLEARRIQLDPRSTLESFAAEAGVSVRTLLDLLTGRRRVFQRGILIRLNRAWRLPPGTIDQVLTGDMPAEVIADIPAAPTGPDFVSHLHTELAARGARLPTPVQLEQAEKAWQATAEFQAAVGSPNPEVQAALEAAISTVAALADLLKSAGGLTDQQRDGLAMVDQLAGKYPHMSARDLEKIRADVMRGLPPVPAVTGDAAPGRQRETATSGR